MAGSAAFPIAMITFTCVTRLVSRVTFVREAAIMKPAATFRNYDEPTRDTVREFYRQNHAHQTLDFVLEKKADYLRLARKKMTVWEALDYLNTLVDDSDPD